ncbi:hypothetical protein PACTADRAFT_49505 [Pachysolen tannophilus NRRL Y-2460]|uniref:Uncharacterized protein n=1 Tax=Pachysolen tannophilus NRRL Y-2460 TaxID=669874 RepID=A0A1E4TWI2_PACTA|nr:hypothetical protein PACTADRAFT_49505 [Pachysolen tannophilus NRRL Y-2460]
MTVPSNKSCHSNLYLQVVTTLMLSNKFLNDSSYTLKTWSDLSYVDQKILWKHELKILNKFKFKLNISTNEWKNWESFLKLSCKEFGINCDELFRYNDEKIKEKSKLISEIPKQQSEAHFLLTPCSPKTVLINKSGKRSRSEYQDTTTTTNNFYNQEPLFNNDSNKKLKTTTASTASSSTISGSSLSSNNYFSSPFSLPYFSQDMGQSTDINSTLSDKQYYQQQLSLLRYYSSLQQQQQPQQPQQQQQQYPEPYCSFQDQQYQQQQHHQQRFTSNCRMVVPPLKTQYNPIEMMNSVYNPNSLNFLASPSLLSPEHTIIYPEQQQLGFNYSTTTTYSGNYYNQ